MSHFFGYVDASNNMYVFAGSTSVDYTHNFPQSWTKVPVKVKQAVISNEDYNSACDGYIDTSDRLYIWRNNQTPVLVDTNVKQADSSEEGILAYVKNDGTLWLAYTKDATITKKQVATNAEYVVIANWQVAYRSISGDGYFAHKTSNNDIDVTFTSVGSVKMVAVTGGSSGYPRYMYIDGNDRLLASPFNNATIANFSVIATNVASVKKGGWEFPYLTKNAELYHIHNGNSPVLIASNVADYWSNKTWGAEIDALYYTTKDQPTKLKASNGANGSQGAKVPNVLSTPTSVKTMGSTYGGGIVNNAPTIPGAFTQQPIANSMNLTGETVELAWGASTDPEGNAFTYALEFYNGSSWQSVASGLNVTTCTFTLPSLNIDNAQLRVRATDSNGGNSSYRESNYFAIRKYLILIQDGDIIKTYKNGAWQTI